LSHVHFGVNLDVNTPRHPEVLNMANATLVTSCAATACSFNNGGCTVAITVGGSESASCVTFVELDARASVSAEGQVSACKRLECVHNSDLVCTAGEITVSDTADCLTYAVA